VVVTVKGESCDALVKALWYAMKKRQLNSGLEGGRRRSNITRRSVKQACDVRELIELMNRQT